MLDRRIDSPDYNLCLLRVESFQRILCLAPHPDDEVLGCGGLLTLAHQRGATVHTVIVTAGQAGTDYVNVLEDKRLAESIKAAEVLGVPKPFFWNFIDRELRHSPPLIDKITEEIINFNPDLVLLPALTEPHPDHQVLALAGQQAIRNSGVAADILFYEVGAPTQVNTLLDITEVSSIKWKALEEFLSQELNHPYLKHAQAMSAVRAFGAGEKVHAAEAFWHIKSHELNNFLATSWTSQRTLKKLALDAEELPLISVIIRSMDRATLKQAISVISEQSYPNIEVVIVNATGNFHSIPKFPTQRLTLNFVGANGNLGRLGRSAAANQGIIASRGEYAIFLDDDDLIFPEHLEKLLNSLHGNSSAVAAYSDVKVEGKNGEFIREYNSEWHPLRINGINFLPIHSVLFNLKLVKKEKIIFDTDLPVLEDWDFWCHLAQKGDFLHVSGISAIYRQGLGTSNISDPESNNFWSIWHKKIIEKHISSLGKNSVVESLAWYSLSLDLEECKNKKLSTELDDLKLVKDKLFQSYNDIDEVLKKTINELDHEKSRSDFLTSEMRYLSAEVVIKTKEINDLKNEIENISSQRSNEVDDFNRKINNLNIEKSKELSLLKDKINSIENEREKDLIHWKEKIKFTELERDLILNSLKEEIKNVELEKNRILEELDLMKRSFELLENSRSVKAAKLIRKLFGI